MFFVIILELVYVQVIRGRYFFNLSTNNRIRIVPLEGWRGRILDRNKVVLADSRIAYDVMISPQDINDPKALFHYLGEVLGTDAHILEKRYNQKKIAPFAPVVIANDIGREKAIVIEENKYRYPSIILKEGFKREYPLGPNSVHILGYVGKMNRAKRERYKEYGYTAQSVVGYGGVEEYYDEYLKGGEGGLQIEVNSRGQQVRLLSVKQPNKGRDIMLTVDSAVQRLAMDALADAIGAVVVMDTDSGEVIAMASSPDYDPNIFVDQSKQKLLTGLFADKSAPLLNRAIKGLFPPGSVFKVPLAVGALDSEKISQYTTYDCVGFYTLGGRRFRCVHVHGPLDLIASLARSCNVYYYRVGLNLGVELISRYARYFGLGRLTDIDLPYEEAGHIPDRRQRFQASKTPWYAGDTLNLSVGQGDVLVTPLQLVRMMATIANDGIEVRPHVIGSIGGSPVEQRLGHRKIRFKEGVLDTVKKGLRAAVTDTGGTASAMNLEQLYIAGKTGTAQTSGGKEDHAWFVGYVKDARKNITFCVFLEHGGSSVNATVVSRNLLLSMKEQKLL